MRLNISNIVTILAALIIVVAGVEAINIYASHEEKTRINKVGSTFLQLDNDISLERKVFNSECIITGSYKEVKNFNKFSAITDEIIKEYAMDTRTEKTGYTNGDSYIIKLKDNSQEINVFINEKNRAIEFQKSMVEINNAGKREEGFVKVQDDRDSTGSELYSLINAILKGCIKENMVSPKLDTIKKIMGDFNGEEIFWHGDKFYIPFRNNEKYIVIMYDYKNKEYCGGKLVLGE